MAIILKRSEYPAISESGLYVANIKDVTTCKSRNNAEKIVLTIQPRDYESQKTFRKMEVWLDNDGDIDKRINALSDALMDFGDDLETAIGEDIGIVVKINEEHGTVYANVVNFFDVDSDSVIEDEDEDDEDDEDEEDDECDLSDVEDNSDLSDDDDDNDISIKYSKTERKSPPKRRNSRR